MRGRGLYNGINERLPFPGEPFYGDNERLPFWRWSVFVNYEPQPRGLSAANLAYENGRYERLEAERRAQVAQHAADRIAERLHEPKALRA